VTSARPASTILPPARRAQRGAIPLSRRQTTRLHILARLARWSRWEFWPAAIVYAPLVPHLGWLALRHRGLSTCTAANPCIPMGGLVGESKWAILSLLPRGCAVSSAIIEPAALPERTAALDAACSRLGLDYPIVLKPDVGDRGAGVRLVADRDAAHRYLASEPRAVLVQAHHPGPREAGIFYTRHPDAPRGEILSITDKRFPVIAADGRSTLRELILRHHRFRMQARTFLARLGPRAHEVHADGRTVRLAFAGNHCQGTMFLDGSTLITPELTAAIEGIARQIPGFYFGRFDVRYADETELKAGRGFAIVELNGVLSESTNIYDPATGFWAGQRVLREQWRRAFEIGAANRRTGAQAASVVACAAVLLAHARRKADRRAD